MTEEIEVGEAVQPDAPDTSVGKQLAAARNQLGLSVAEVARQLRLSASQIDAMETDNHGRLPGKTFLRGFIRNYAKLLQIDPEPLLARCNPELPQALPIAMPVSRIEFGSKRRLMPFGDRPDRNWKKYFVTAGLIVLVLSLLWGGYALFQGQSLSSGGTVKPSGEATMALSLPASEFKPPVPPAINPANETALPLPPEEAAAPVVPVPAEATILAPVSLPVADAGGQQLQFAFDADSWVEVKDKNAKVISYQLNLKGAPLIVRGNPPFYLVIGNATHVKLTYNEKPVDLVPYIKVNVARLTIE